MPWAVTISPAFGLSAKNGYWVLAERAEIPKDALRGEWPCQMRRLVWVIDNADTFGVSRVVQHTGQASGTLMRTSARSKHGQRVEWLYSASRKFRPGRTCRYWPVAPNQHDPGRSTGRHDPARDGGASQKLGGSGRRSSPVSNPSGSGRASGMESGHPREGNNRSPPDKSLRRRPAQALLATALSAQVKAA